MRINSELIKTAIADAKAIRVTAYANAKASLEEAFAPRFEAMFADKLKEDAEEEQEEAISEVEAPNQVSGKGGEAKGPKTKAVTKGQPKKVSDGNTNFKTVAVGGSEGAAGSKAPGASVGISESAEEEEEEGKSMDENYEEEEESVAEAGLTSEDLDEVIRELEAEVADEEEGKHVEEPVDSELPPAPEGGEGHEEVPHDHSEPDGDEVPGEGDPEAHDHHDDSGDGEEIPGEEPGETPADGEEVNIDVNPAPPVESPFGHGGHAGHTGEEDEEINLEELLAALNEEAEEEDDEEEEGKSMDESTDGLPKNDLKGQNKSGGVKGYPKAPHDASKKQVKGKNHNIGGKGNIGTGATGGLSEVTKYETALKEAYDTIEFLRGQINEVNLLNAKLLYTNRLFKDFATVIDENYRMKIVESFDLTKSVREVKLAYALLAESLSFSTTRKQVVTTKPAPKADTSSKRSVAKQITEGLASKPVASTKPSKQIISEGADEMAKRFQKLAGIKKPVDPKK